jgi:AraC-like DNA-binding protein
MSSDPLFDKISRLFHRRTPSIPPSRGDREFLDRFNHTVMEHYSDPGVTTDVVAAIMGISRMHLNRRLHRLTGRSTHALILERRLEIAVTMLSQPLPIAFVAKSVGFRSTSHFAKAFRKKLEMSPSEFQARRSLPRQPTEEQ